MNYLKLIGILIISSATAAMDPPSNNTNEQQKIAQNIERAKVELEANGFVTFSNLDESILTHEELNGLKKLLSMSTFQPPSQDEAHATGSMHEFEVQFKRNDMEPAEIIIGQRTINNVFSSQIIKKVAQQILKIFPTKSSGAMDLILYSDLERVIDSACEEVLACKTPKTIEIELAPLVFHQDQWENIPYEYLYFQVIDLNGFTEHYSLLGRVKEEVSGTHKNKYSTKSYELADLEEAPIRLKCVPGSGYGVKQLDPIVHSRTFARTLVSNIYDEEKCREYGFNEAEGRQLCVKYSNPLPARLVFVVRIS